MTDSGFRFVALQLCFLLAVVYAGQVFLGFDPAYSASSSPFYKFFTSVLGHSSTEHLFNNLFFIAVFGSIYELMTSGRMLLATFLVSAFFANLSAFLFFPGSSIIGASGGGMGILAALAFYRPRKIGLALGVPLPMWAALLAYVFINFAGLTAPGEVAHEAHLMGILAGALIGLSLRERPYTRASDDSDTGLDDWRSRIREWEEKWMLD